MSKMGQRPSTHTGVNRAQHIGYNTSGATSGTTHRMQHRVQHIGVTSGTIHRTQHRTQYIGVTSSATHRAQHIGYNTSGTIHRAQHTYINTYCFTNAYQPPIYARVLSRGVAPISTFCPYRARYFLNPVHGGEPRVSQSFGLLYPGLRYPCPYRAPRVQNH